MQEKNIFSNVPVNVFIPQPDIHMVYFMANVLGTSADYLTGKTDNPKPNTYWINANTEPELFSLIETYSKSGDSTKELLLSYFLKLSEAK